MKVSPEKWKNVRNTRQKCHLSNYNKSHNVRYDTIIVRTSEVSFTYRKKLHLSKILRFRSRTNNNNNNNNRLPSKLSRWLENPGGTRFWKLIKEISQEELNACLYVSTHLRGLQLQKFIYEIRTSGHNVRFLRSVSHRLVGYLME